MRATHKPAIRKFIVPALMLALFNTAPSHAGGYRAASDIPTSNGFQDTARVVASAPVYESINEPQRECWDAQVGNESVGSRDRNYGGAIIGGLVGGLLGNQIGKGSGRQWGTAIGAATGAIAGNNIDNDGRELHAESRPRFEQRCRNVDNWSRKLTGYSVTYRYQGHEYNTFMPYDPGRNVRINVNVSLAER